ncbi:3,4-dihydroxy-2-butanone-4-phosphate synthase [Chytriomyces confervae]|uniref:3,4-dihydroxy-2-butanone-4-phosphate synthase n=1 Tax=Chytriomyces confervae TaxID=246404 RepID=A0A507F7J5_9FUNG|nr:hypothetical protein HDU80_010692 [Chytriomyces hyalinus]TPX71600.1 3,4-dihydroxy-2-butanone-4-phosphate synthase [Chytriomyces confervae]
MTPVKDELIALRGIAYADSHAFVPSGTVVFSRTSGTVKAVSPDSGSCDLDLEGAAAVDGAGYLLLPAFVDAGIIGASGGQSLPETLRLAVAQGSSVSVVANFGDSIGASADPKHGTVINFGSQSAASATQTRFSRGEHSLNLSHGYSAVLSHPQRGDLNNASGPVALSQTPSVWPYIRDQARSLLQSSSPNGKLDAALLSLLKSVSEDSCKHLGLEGIRGQICPGAIADFILIKLDSQWVLSAQGTLLPLYLSQTTPSRIHTVLIGGTQAYTLQNSQIAQSLAAATLSKYYVEPNLPPSVVNGDMDATVEHESSKFNTIPEAIEAIQRGEVIIVVDNEDRENEGDFVFAAEDATPEKLAFVIRHSGGVICVPMEGHRLDALKLPLMVENNEDSLKTAYTISVDYKHGTTTGISSHDRAKTLVALSDPSAKATDFQRPGHVFPLRAVNNGVLSRVGHTEASLDLCRLAGKQMCAGISEVVLDEGGMARRDDMFLMAKKWNMCIITVDALVRYRVANGV